MSAVASPFNPSEQATFDAQVSKVLAQYPADRQSAALIPVLHIAQSVHGWLKPETMDYCGHLVGVPPKRVREVVTFYSMFHLRPVGRTHVQVCVNLSCWLAGSDKLVQTCRDRIGPDQKTPYHGGSLSWAEVECLASCGPGAPAAQINETYKEPLSVAELEKLIDAARK